MADKERIIDRIVKLFRLGTADRNNSEAEAAAAVTKARVLMAEHDISMYDVEMKAGQATAKRIEFEINEHTAYTRKIRDLAVYDHAVATAVAVLTSTRPMLYHMHAPDGWYTKMVFVGTTTDAAVASELFIILLQTVRRLARATYGGGNTWGKQHTSFALGCAVRLAERAREAVQSMTPANQTSTALIVRGKAEAIQAWFDKIQVRPAQHRKTAIDDLAYTAGWVRGGSVSLNRSGLRGGQS